MLAFIFMALMSVAPETQTLVVYSSDGCPPCRRFKRDYQRHPELAEGRTVEIKDGASEDARRDRISVVPTFIILHDGVEVDRVSGYSSLPALLRWINQQP